MAAPFVNAAPKTKLVFEKSSFANQKSSHDRVIGTKYFTHNATIIVPYHSSAARLPTRISDLEKKQMSFLVHGVPLHLILDKHFIEAFVKKGQLYAMSHKRHIDTQNCVAVIPTGHLILNVTKDTYEQLGLDGQPSAFSGRHPSKYVIDVDLKPDSFAPGRKGYERVLWCLKDRLDLTFDLLVSWTPHDPAVCPSSVAKFFTHRGLLVSPAPFRVETQWLNQATIPVLDSSHFEESNKHCGREALWEWLGAVACEIDMCESAPDSYVCTLCPPSPSLTCQQCCVLSITGFLTPAATSWLLDLVREEVESEGTRALWGSLTLQGFQDSPVSVSNREHGFLQSGDNLHSFLCFPDHHYWLYSLYGQHDFCQ